MVAFVLLVTFNKELVMDFRKIMMMVGMVAVVPDLCAT